MSPIRKKGPTISPENYRPISITATGCRVMEKIINKSIILHLTHHKLIDNNQHGFIPTRSTLTNILECIQQWTDTIHNKQNMSYVERLRRCKLTNLEIRISRGDLRETFKILTGRGNLKPEHSLRPPKAVP